MSFTSSLKKDKPKHNNVGIIIGLIELNAAPQKIKDKLRINATEKFPIRGLFLR